MVEEAEDFFFPNPQSRRKEENYWNFLQEATPSEEWDNSEMFAQDTHWRYMRIQTPQRAWSPERDAAAETWPHCWTNTRRPRTDWTGWWTGGSIADVRAWRQTCKVTLQVSLNYSSYTLDSQNSSILKRHWNLLKGIITSQWIHIFHIHFTICMFCHCRLNILMHHKRLLVLTSRTRYQGICIPESNLSWSRYAAKGFSSSHGKPGSTAKEDKEVHWLKKKPLK